MPALQGAAACHRCPCCRRLLSVQVSVLLRDLWQKTKKRKVMLRCPSLMQTWLSYGVIPRCTTHVHGKQLSFIILQVLLWMSCHCDRGQGATRAVIMHG